MRNAFVLVTALLCCALASATPAAGRDSDERTLVRRTTLIVADIEKSIAFYRDTLGYSLWYYHAGTVTEGSLPADAEPGDPSVFAIMKGRHPWIGMVGLLQKGQPKDVSVTATGFSVSPGDTILMMETDDLDGIYARMLEAETPIWKHPETTTVTGAGGRQWDATFLFAFDPDGHLLEINQPHFGRGPEKTIRRAFADTRSGQLHYRHTPQGDGTPLLLLHQTPLSGRMYRHLIPLLAEHRQVLAPDTPGYGESDLPEALPGIDDYADAIIDLLDDLGINQADVFGYHTGSAIAVELAARYPQRVRNVILMSVPLFDVEEMRKWQLAPPEYEASGDHLLAMWNSTYTHRAPGQTLDMVAATVAEKQRAGRNEWWALRALSLYPLGETLSQLAQPVSILNPGDGLFDRSRRASELVDATHYVEMPDWGYGVFDTKAGEIAALIDRFCGVPGEAPGIE